MKIPPRPRKGYINIIVNVPYAESKNIALKINERTTLNNIIDAIAKRYETTPEAFSVYCKPHWDELFEDQSVKEFFHDLDDFDPDAPREPDLVVNHDLD